jgi:putative hydrolase of the HAD superfamily
MIRLVTFDFWETLVADRADHLAAQEALRVEAICRALDAAGAALSRAEIEAAYGRTAGVLVERYWGRHRDLPCPDQVKVVMDCIVPGAASRLDGAAMDELIAGYGSPVLAHPPALQPGAAEALRGLAAAGVRLGIISNTGRTPGVILRRVLEAADLLEHFSVVSYSDEVGFRKPDAEIFRRTLTLAGARPEGAAHIGDNPVDDVTGAQGAGMLGIHYTAGRRSPAAHADLVVSDLSALPGLIGAR